MARIDAVHRPLKGGVLEIFENSSANRSRSFGGPNQGHGIREQQCIQAGLRVLPCVLVHAGRGPILTGVIVELGLSVRVCLAGGDQRINSAGTIPTTPLKSLRLQPGYLLDFGR